MANVNMNMVVQMSDEDRIYFVKHVLTTAQQDELAIRLSEIEAKKDASEAPPAKKAKPLFNNKEFMDNWKELVGFNTYADLSKNIMFRLQEKHHIKAGSHVEKSKSEEPAEPGNVCVLCRDPATTKFPQPAGKTTVYSCDSCKDDVAEMSKKVPAAEGPGTGVLMWQIEQRQLAGQETLSEGTIVVRMEWYGSMSRKYHGGQHHLYLPFNAEGIVLLHMYEACWARNKILQIRPKDNCDKCGKGETTDVCRNKDEHGIECGALINNKARINIHFKSSITGTYGYPDANFFRYHGEMAGAGVFKKDIISPSLRNLVDRSQVGENVA